MRSIQQTLVSFTLLALLFSAVKAADNAGDERARAYFPHTDIFIFDLALSEGKATIADPENATDRQGYDNQPFFTPDSTSFVYSRGDDYQTDAYEYDLNTKQSTQLTASYGTEFSPTPIYDNSALLFVSDRNGSVWQGERANPNEPKWFLEASDNREPIGYFALNQKTNDLLYWSRYGFSMALVNQNDSSYHFVAGNTPPATPHVIPKTNLFSFVHRQMNEQVWIKSLDPKSKAITPLIAVNGSNYNYTWAPDQSILMIQDGVLYQAKPYIGETWSEVAILAEHGITNANRLAVSPNGKRLAVVGVELKP